MKENHYIRFYECFIRIKKDYKNTSTFTVKSYWSIFSRISLVSLQFEVS